MVAWRRRVTLTGVMASSAGYFEEYPEYQTQGESLEDLQEHLKDLFHDLTSGEIPRRRVAHPRSVPILCFALWSH